MIHPDYGAYLLGEGYDGVQLSHYDVPITRLSCVRPGLFTTSINLIITGTEYAVSFDLDQAMIVRMCRVLEITEGDVLLGRLAELAPGHSLEFVPPKVLKRIDAKLGSPQHATKEVFVPLVVQDIG